MAPRGNRNSRAASTLEDNIYDASPPPATSSPAASISSDKENRAASRRAMDKGKGRAPMGDQSTPSVRSGNARKRPAEQEQSGDRSRRRTIEVDEEEGGSEEHEYDPEQDIHERRRIRKGLRNLNKNLLENRSEFLAPDSKGLRDTIISANQFTKKVKQTVDATIDSRLFVTISDLSLKKTNALLSGDNATGVDIDDFLMRVKQYCRLGAADDDAPSATQHRRRGRRGSNSDEEEDDGGELWNWGYFGRHACIKHISRPTVPGFLLGPLSLEKRVRKVVVRQERLKHTQMTETRPEVLKADDIERDDENNLTSLCTRILTELHGVRDKAMKSVQNELGDEPAEEEIEKTMDRYGISPDGGMAYFKFVLNPKSFGQSVENMFYVSFLIRDGKLGITVDHRGLPYLNITTNGSTQANGKNKEAAKHQAVLELSMAKWEECIDVFDITEPMIKHRSELVTEMPAKGWMA